MTIAVVWSVDCGIGDTRKMHVKTLFKFGNNTTKLCYSQHVANFSIANQGSEGIQGFQNSIALQISCIQAGIVATQD